MQYFTTTVHLPFLLKQKHTKLDVDWIRIKQKIGGLKLKATLHKKVCLVIDFEMHFLKMILWKVFCKTFLFFTKSLFVCEQKCKKKICFQISKIVVWMVPKYKILILYVQIMSG